MRSQKPYFELLSIQNSGFQNGVWGLTWGHGGSKEEKYKFFSFAEDCIE